MRKAISIIIPVLREEARINDIIASVRRCAMGDEAEIIVIDGSEDGASLSAVKDTQVIVLRSKPGRALQMNMGAQVACGDMLLFLHADTTVPSNALTGVDRVFHETRYVGGAFKLRFDSAHWWMNILSRAVQWRVACSRVPYGDQAIFIRREYFLEHGGYRDMPLLEDVDLMERIRHRGHDIVILPHYVTTSARRWQRDGYLWTTLRNRMIMLLYMFGVSPEKLARLYR